MDDVQRLKWLLDDKKLIYKIIISEEKLFLYDLNDKILKNTLNTRSNIKLFIKQEYGVINFESNDIIYIINNLDEIICNSIPNDIKFKEYEVNINYITNNSKYRNIYEEFNFNEYTIKLNNLEHIFKSDLIINYKSKFINSLLITNKSMINQYYCDSSLILYDLKTSKLLINESDIYKDGISDIKSYEIVDFNEILVKNPTTDYQAICIDVKIFSELMKFIEPCFYGSVISSNQAYFKIKDFNKLVFDSQINIKTENNINLCFDSEGNKIVDNILVRAGVLEKSINNLESETYLNVSSMGNAGIGDRDTIYCFRLKVETNRKLDIKDKKLLNIINIEPVYIDIKNGEFTFNFIYQQDEQLFKYLFKANLKNIFTNLYLDSSIGYLIKI